MLRRICNVLSIVLIVIMLLIAAVLLVPYVFGYKPMAVVSGSMKPTYPVGSVTFVKEVSPETIAVNDIITFSGRGKPTTHRVLSIDPEKRVFVTKGDNNSVADGEIAFDRLIGRASEFSIPLIGYISLFVQESAAGKLTAVAVALVIILLAFLPDALSPKPAPAPCKVPAEKADDTALETADDTLSAAEKETVSAKGPVCDDKAAGEEAALKTDDSLSG